MFKSRVNDCSMQVLSTQINSSLKAIAYKLYKSCVGPEKYLTIPFTYIHKRALSNFRCSSHNLMIEKGRHMNIDRDYRFCRFCLRNGVYVVENELHFLLICPLYASVRAKHFRPEWTRRVICEDLFVQIMSDERDESLYSLARYIEESFTLRESVINV